MRKERRKEAVRKGTQALRNIQFENDLDDQLEAGEEEGQTLDDLIENGYMIKCEGCNQILKTDTFFKHASQAQKCKKVYGERLEVMKKEKRKKVRQLSEKKNKVPIQEFQAKYYVKNKELVGKQKSQKFQENLSKEKDIEKAEDFDNWLLRRNYDLERRIKKIIIAWKDCRDQDVKQLRKSDAMFMDDSLSLEVFNMKEKINQTVKEYETKLENTIDEWKLRDRKKYNLNLEKLFDEWKMYARNIDNSFKGIEKATGKNLTCYQCIISGRHCYPRCESTIDETDNKIQKLKPYDLEIP